MVRTLGCLVLLSSMACLDIAAPPSSDIAEDAFDVAAHLNVALPESGRRLLFIPSSGLAPLSGGERNTAFLALGLHALGFDVTVLAGLGEGLKSLQLDGVETISYQDLTSPVLENLESPIPVKAFKDALSSWSAGHNYIQDKKLFLEELEQFEKIPNQTLKSIDELLALPRDDIRSIAARTKILHDVIQKRGIEVVLTDSHEDGLIALLATRNTQTRAVLYVQSSDSEHYDKIFERELDIVTCSSTSAKRFSTPKNLKVVTNGINLRKFSPKPDKSCAVKESLGLPCDALLIGHTGYIGPNKNQLAIVKASIIAARYLPKVHVALVGAALDKPYAEEISVFAEQFNFSGHLHFLGVRKDIADILAGLDLFVFPSHQEGFGLSLAEAMATGIPCIANDIKTFHTFAEGGAWLLNTDDQLLLSEAIIAILSAPGCAKEMGDRAYVQANKCNLSSDRMLKDFAKFLGATESLPGRKSSPL